MTSVHMNTSESQATTPTSTINGTASNQIPSITSKYDDINRQRQRLERLRQHHAASVTIHQRTQPMIDEQIREDTSKLVNSGSVNGTKAKSQKPRAPKRQRTSTSSNNSANNSISTNINNTKNVIIQSQIHTPTGAKGVSNGLQHQQATMPPLHNIVPPHSQQQHIIQQQAQPQAQIVMSAGMQPMQQISYSPHMQQTMQQPMHTQRQPQPSQMNPNHSYNDSYQNQYQPPPIYSQQRHQMQPTSHSVQSMHTLNQNQSPHYMNHQSYAQQDQQSFYQPQSMMNNHYSTLPNDLDLNIQAGLECDIDSLIKHEVSIEGQLNFNPDLLDRLVDGYYNHH